MKQNKLLIIDGIINVLLGILLILFPLGMDHFLSLPYTSTYFYTTIFGAVLIGIGIALFIECKIPSSGLGLIGAIIINICGASALLLSLFIYKTSIPTFGLIILVVIAILVFLLALLELIQFSKRKI
jgi:hypothetical protein